MKRGVNEVNTFVVDTSVLIEYIVERAPYRKRAERLLDMASTGEVELYLNPVTLSETLYIASRIYEASGIRDPNGEAMNYLNWIRKRVRLSEIHEETAIRAGELKKELRIALADCYVIATSKELGVAPLFARPEREMKPILKRMRELGVKFLEEITL